GVREVQHVFLQERPRELELLRREPVVYELLELAQGGAQREVRLLVRQRTDPYFENLMPAGYVHGRHLPFAAFRESLDVRVVAVVQTARFADHLKQMARLIAVLAQPGIRNP